MNPKAIKIAGVVLSVAGVAVNIAAEAIADKKLDLKIEEKVAQAIENLNK